MASTKLSQYNSRSNKTHHGSALVGNAEKRVSHSEVPVQTPDFLVENHNSIFLLRPLTDAARNWVEEHIGQDNGYQPYFPTVVIDHSYISDIVVGIQNDGLVCR
jgi:hypothetical protein